MADLPRRLWRPLLISTSSHLLIILSIDIKKQSDTGTFNNTNRLALIMARNNVYKSVKPFSSVREAPMVGGISPVHPIQHNSHVTIHIGHATQDQIWCFPRTGLIVGFKIVGMVVTDSIQAAIITFVSGMKDSVVTSGMPHITISTATGVAPKMSKDAIKNAIKNGTVIPSSDSAIHFGIVSNNRS